MALCWSSIVLQVCKSNTNAVMIRWSHNHAILPRMYAGEGHRKVYPSWVSPAAKRRGMLRVAAMAEWFDQARVPQLYQEEVVGVTIWLIATWCCVVHYTTQERTSKLRSLVLMHGALDSAARRTTWSTFCPVPFPSHHSVSDFPKHIRYCFLTYLDYLKGRAMTVACHATG